MYNIHFQYQFVKTFFSGLLQDKCRKKIALEDAGIEKQSTFFTTPTIPSAISKKEVKKKPGKFD